jgi:hypothetical protein
MLGAQDLWVGKDLYRSTPTVTRGLGFSGLIRRTAPFSRLLRHMRGCGGSILTRILTGVIYIVRWKDWSYQEFLKRLYIKEFVCFLFIAAWSIFQLSGGGHHYRWLGCKFRPMLGAQGLWAGRDLYRATPTATRNLGLYGLIRKTGTHVPQWGSNPRLKDHQIFEPKE